MHEPNITLTFWMTPLSVPSFLFVVAHIFKSSDWRHWKDLWPYKTI